MTTAGCGGAATTITGTTQIRERGAPRRATPTITTRRTGGDCLNRHKTNEDGHDDNQRHLYRTQVREQGRIGAAMLILTRKPGERLKIGDDITVTVLKIDGRAVSIGVAAPPNVIIDREEVAERRAKGWTE